MTIKEFVIYFQNELAPLEWYDGREVKSMASYLLKELAGVESYKLIVEPQLLLDPSVEAALVECTGKISKGEPLQYALGYEYFCGHKFAVASGVLIPRPETEELVRMVVANSNSLATVSECTENVWEAKTSELKILDICTGSGCIAWSLAAALPGSRLFGCDISDEALAIARSQKIFTASHISNSGNDSGDGNSPKVSFFKCDILDCSAADLLQRCKTFDRYDGFSGFDIIVSNPPYVCEVERGLMRANVLDHEPQLALFVPDDDPLRFYRRIVELSGRYGDTGGESAGNSGSPVKKGESAAGRGGLLKEGGMLYFEVNERFANEVAELMRDGGFVECEVVRDMFGKERMVRGRRI
ncbi:MAG: peptide chain release factor N(5)-glutamine methyltransferase [Bacteroidales bacterium]|nr:peptide chain release factor N(5)-glutamine methyltransferase [Bacteroidales bacterium]